MGFDAIIGALADRQYGIVTRIQLLELGLHPTTIDRALKTCRLRPVFRGVYAVGHRSLSREAWWKAALPACGPGAALAGRSAATLLGLHDFPLHPVEVVTLSQRGRTQRGLRTWRMRLDHGGAQPPRAADAQARARRAPARAGGQRSGR